MKYIKSVYPFETFKVDFVCFNTNAAMLEFSQLLFCEAENYYPPREKKLKKTEKEKGY